MSVAADVRAHIIDTLRAIVPDESPSLPYICEDDANGKRVDLETAIKSKGVRLFRLRSRSTEDAGITAVENPWVNSRYVIQLGYSVADREQADVLIDSDAQVLTRELRDPANWGSVGIDGIVVAPEDRIDEEVGGGVIVSLPIMVRHRTGAGS